MVWTIANTLTIVFIAKGIEATGGEIDVNRATTQLLIGAVVWAYLGIMFEFMTETVAWERWEGTIEYTFMAPLSRAMHLAGAGFFAVLYGLIRAIILFVVVAFFFDLEMPNADFLAAFVVLVVGSVAFIGIGMMTAVLPLISPEKGAQLGFVAQGMLLVVSGVYYPVEVLPQWMQWLSVISPATYVLDGIRDAILDGAGLSTMWDEIWPLLLIGVVAAPGRPLGLPPRRDLREEAREAEEDGIGDDVRLRQRPRSGRLQGFCASRIRESGFATCATNVRRVDAHRVWLGYTGRRGVRVRARVDGRADLLHPRARLQPARARARRDGARGGVLRLRDPDGCRRRHVRPPALDDPRRARPRARVRRDRLRGRGRLVLGARPSWASPGRSRAAPRTRGSPTRSDVSTRGGRSRLGAQAARIGGLLGIAAAVGLALVDLRLPIVAGGVLLVALAGALALVMPETASARRDARTSRRSPRWARPATEAA